MRAIDILQAEHRVKEEEILFPAMVEAGFPRNSGQIAAMLHEHAVSRSYNWVLQSYSEQERSWSSDDRTQIASRASSHAGLLRAHIKKEDGILYPLARQRLTAASMAKVDARCA